MIYHYTDLNAATSIANNAQMWLTDYRFLNDKEEFKQGFEVLLEALGNDSNLLIVFYVQIMPDDFVMQLHRF
ncbi:Permease%2C cytosine/purine%2C uracil%2C thiamine%2C allantoin family [Escherichia coli]|nr:Permease%2C cytosine/purine%2C uracil%2C thiamine%2C allantoin family [Escherichia coli]